VLVVPGAQAARARNLRNSVVDDHAHGDADIRHRAQPIVCAQPVVQRRGHGRFHAAVGKRSSVHVRQDRTVVDQRPDDVP